MARKIVADPRRLRDRMLEPEKLRLGDDFQLLEERGQAPLKRGADLEIVDLRVSSDELEKAAETPPEEAVKIGKALISDGERNDVALVYTARIKGRDEILREVHDSMDRMHHSPDIVGMVSAGTDALKTLGFSNPRIYLPNEDGEITRVGVSGEAGRRTLVWGDMSKQEVALTLATTKQELGTTVFNNRGEDLSRQFITEGDISSLFGEVKPFAIVPVKSDSKTEGLIIVDSRDEITGWQTERLNEVAKDLAFNRNRVMLSTASNIKGLERKEQFAEYGIELARNAVEKSLPLSMAWADVDGLHDLNETFESNDVGSAFMDAVGTLVRRTLRQLKTGGRIRAFSWSGTDEIPVIANLGKEEMVEAMRELRKTVAGKRETGPQTREEKELNDLLAQRINDLNLELNPEDAFKQWWRTVTIGVASYPDDTPLMKGLVEEKGAENVTRDDLIGLRSKVRERANETCFEMKKSGARNTVGAFGEVRIQNSK